MANERLRNSISAVGLTLDELARHVQVDPKTVERWVRIGRVPHPRHRREVASLLGATEAFLWPDLLDDDRGTAAAAVELIQLYPHRGAVPAQLWVSLMGTATQHVDVLVYAGLFLWDGHPDLPHVIAQKGRAGTAVRLALGDPGSDAVRRRGEEEGIGDGMAARIHLSLRYLLPAVQVPRVELRLHATVLYNSIYRFDNDMLVNCHAFGAPAAHSPVLHYRRLEQGRLFDHYMASFERVWAAAAVPAAPEVSRWVASTT
jgi:hypothetical protein